MFNIFCDCDQRIFDRYLELTSFSIIWHHTNYYRNFLVELFYRNTSTKSPQTKQNEAPGMYLYNKLLAFRLQTKSNFDNSLMIKRDVRILLFINQNRSMAKF